MLFFCIIEIMWNLIFTGKTSLLQAEIAFLPSEKPFFYLSDIQGSENSFSYKKRFFNKFFIPTNGNEFSV